MNLSSFLLTLAVLCAVWAVTSAVLITVELDRRGIRTSFLLFRLLLFRNLSRYREITRNETGKVGPLFYSYVIAINAALLLGLVALGSMYFLAR